jgi:hypothetical protein
MGFGQALSSIFEDRHWANKLAMVTLLAAASLIPIVGLVALAALLGYMVEIVANVKRRVPGVLPVWSNFEKKIGDGAALLAAIFVYNIPNFILSGCLLTAPRVFGGNIAVSWATTVVTFCCLVPFMLIYTVTAWSMLAAAIVRFSESGKAGEFYRFNTLLQDVQRNGSRTLNWIALATFLNIILSMLTFTICGALLSLAFAIPLHGHLLGQYGQRVDFAPHVPSKPPSQPSARKPPRRR